MSFGELTRSGRRSSASRRAMLARDGRPVPGTGGRLRWSSPRPSRCAVRSRDPGLRPAGDHAVEPTLEGGHSRARVTGSPDGIPVAIQVLAVDVEACPATRDTVLVGHRQDVQARSVHASVLRPRRFAAGALSGPLRPSCCPLPTGVPATARTRDGHGVPVRVPGAASLPMRMISSGRPCADCPNRRESRGVRRGCGPWPGGAPNRTADTAACGRRRASHPA